MIQENFHHQDHFMVMVKIYNYGRILTLGKNSNRREKNSIFNFHLFVIEEHQGQIFSFINIVMGNIDN